MVITCLPRCSGTEFAADSIVTGICAGGAPISEASAELAGSDSKYWPIARKHFGWHQCARTIGQVSAGILRTSVTSRESTDSACPLLHLATSFGTRQAPPTSIAGLNRTRPT